MRISLPSDPLEQPLAAAECLLEIGAEGAFAAENAAGVRTAADGHARRALARGAVPDIEQFDGLVAGQRLERVREGGASRCRKQIHRT